MARTLRLLAGCALASVVPAFVVAHERAGAAPSAAHEDEATPAEAAARKRKKVTELFVAMNQKELAERSFEESLGSISAMGLPDSFRTCFEDKFSVDKVLEMTADVYVEQLDEPTIDALLVFFRSDGAKSYVEKLPDITVETLKRNTEYGKQIGIECAGAIRGK